MPADKGLRDQQEAFCQEYLADLNATQAAIRAGYKQKTAHQQGHALLRNPKVAARIAQMKAERAERAKLTADDVLNRIAAVLQADPAKLTQHHIGCCRYCWGQDHSFQWKTEREFAEAFRKAKAKVKSDATPEELDTLPKRDGGFGYRVTRDPNPECPECAGLGVPYTRFADTDSITGPEKLLFEGVEETKEGLKFRLADKGKHLEMLAKHLGMFPSKVELSGKDGKPIEHDVSVKARVVMVPTKVPSPPLTRPMPADPDDVGAA